MINCSLKNEVYCQVYSHNTKKYAKKNLSCMYRRHPRAYWKCKTINYL